MMGVIAAPAPDQNAWKLASFAGTFCLVEHGIQLLVENDFNADELAAMRGSFDKDRQLKLTARLMDLAEQLRQVQAHLDLVVHELEFGLHVKA